MEQSLMELLNQALRKTESLSMTRELALVVTKIQEAQMWANQYHANLVEAARRSGVGFNQNVHGQQQGPVMTEKPNE